MTLLGIFVDMSVLCGYELLDHLPLLATPVISTGFALKCGDAGLRVGPLFFFLRLPIPITDSFKDSCTPNQAGWHKRATLTLSHWQATYLS